MDNNTKNLVVAVFLMLGVWFLYMSFVQPPVQPVPEVAPGEHTRVVVNAAKDSSAQQPVVIQDVVVENIEEQDVSVETDHYIAVFSNIGARLKSIHLKNYNVTAEPDSGLVSVVDVDNPRLASLRLQGQGSFDIASDAVYKILTDTKTISLSGDERQQLAFRYTTPNGLVVDRVFLFDASSYAIGLDVKINNNGDRSLQGELELSLVQHWTEDDEPAETMVFTGTSTLIDDEIELVDVDDIKKENPSYGNSAIWTAFETKYFMSALVPLDPFETIRIQDSSGTIDNVIITPYQTIEPANSLSYSFLSYFGPRDKAILETVGHQLDRAINYGFFDPIASPLMMVLNYFYGIFGNFGIAIILLTVIIKILFWPLTHKSYASMKSMQKLKPEMDKIKERFKNDRQRQGKETMELYKKHRVNPMGGCLPMLVQIPVFFALYRSLYQAIELRHAPFMLWITDLSAADTLFSDALDLGFALGPLPLIMGFTMFVQQKMTPTAGDPNMAKMMLWMPVIFTFLFLSFPSGLVIYWLINNVLTIAQQYYIHRTMS